MRTLVHAAAVAVTLAAGVHGTPQGGGFGSASQPAVGLARAADANGDGALSGAEWITFLQGLGADTDGALDRLRVEARLLALDPDGDGVTTAADLELVLAAGGPRRYGLLATIVRGIADGDGDGAVSETERETFIAAALPASGGPVAELVVMGWLRSGASLPPPADRNAMTVPVILATLDAALDADANGVLTLSDLNALHRGLDANGDGLIDAGELASAARGPMGPSLPSAAWRNRWSIGADARERPPLMPWQRTLDDALAIAAATGKPLLVCVNMDGENASEALAWGRYRDPDFVALAAGFVPVVASPDRRNARERDDRGRRLADRRFGRLLNSEHIDIEPVLYERYFNSNRVAPRHVGVSPDGKILFDVFLVQDLALVDDKLREYGVAAAAPPDPATLSEAELLASPDAANRDELERRFVTADERTRARLAGLALSPVRATQHAELLHLALRDPSAAVRRQGVWTMVQHAPLAPLALLPPAFAEVGGDPELRSLLVVAARRASEEASDDARRKEAAFIHRVFSTLYEPSETVDVERWRLALSIAPLVLANALTEARMDVVTDALDGLERATDAAPEDVDLWVQLAATRMLLADISLALGRNPAYFFEDAIRACEAALALAPEDGEALAYHAWASHMLSDPETAAEMAARAVPRLVRNAGSPLAARVLEVLANARTSTLYAAIGAGEEWPPATVPDACAAYELLLAHPAGTEAHAKAYLDMLGALRAFGVQSGVLRRALARWPTSGEMHAYLRFQILRDAGSDALEAAYEETPLALVSEAQRPAIDWFRGLATLVGAEQRVNNREAESALAAYGRSIEWFARSIEAAPDFTGSAAHYQCLALAGTARLQSAAGLLHEAADSIVAAVTTAPQSSELADGLGESPADSAREILATLERSDEPDLAVDLATRLAEAGLDVAGGGRAPAER